MDLAQWVQVSEQSIADQPTFYIGCMTGTSVDRYADFTAALFDSTGMPVVFSNQAEPIPHDLQQNLQHLSTSDYKQVDKSLIQQTEHQFTLFLASAYTHIIEQLGLSDYAKHKIILSPHGQTIYHNPAAKETCQLLDGNLLAKLTNYPVAYDHRQACLEVSNAAPLAPVLLRKLFHSDKQHTVVINGGGIANICVIDMDASNRVTAFDTGPANGPLDALIRMIVQDPQLFCEIAPALQAGIGQHHYDVDGLIACVGTVNKTLYQQLMAHEYFTRPSLAKSADLTTFGLTWIKQAWQDAPCSVIDCVTTVAAVVADSISEAVLASLAHNGQDESARVISYGGMVHNTYIIDRIRMNLHSARFFDFISIKSLGYDPDFMESLLMAYLGWCVDRKKPVDLSYMSANGTSAVVPGQMAKYIGN